MFDPKVGDGPIRFLMDLRGDASAPGPGGSCVGALHRTARAKKVRLTVDRRGLVVTVPRSFRYQRELEPLLDRHLEWILRSIEKFGPKPKDALSSPVPVPGRVSFPALDEEWSVELSGAPRLHVSVAARTIWLPKDASRTEALVALRRWTRLRAKDALTPLLLELADEQGARVARVAVKDMRSRWGSCSSKRNINLNARLLFLPPDLVRHVMLHELCHLEAMDHSAAFYASLRAADPDAERHIRELRSAWGRVPPWASEPV